MRRFAVAFSLVLLPLAAFAADVPAGHPPMGSMSAPPAAEAPKATNAGKVAEVVPAGPYIYIRVTITGGEEWLAAAGRDLKPGAQIRYSDGMIMTNYQSKTLNRTFDKVRFVDLVEVVKP